MEIKKAIYAISILSGTIIGVGVFSLPYITLKVGFWTILGYFLVLGTLAILVHLFYGKLALLTPDFKRFSGFVKFHLGKKAEKIALISTILGLFGSILAYLIVGGEFLENLLSPIFGGNNFLYTLLYFSLGAIIIYFGVKVIAKIEFWGLILFFIVLLVIFFQGKFFINVENLFLNFTNDKLLAWPAGGGIENLFLPYGAILFSLWGAALIPEVEEMLGKDKKLLKKIIPIAILIPILVYLFFIYLILGICGSQTTTSAMTGLQNFLGPRIVKIGLLFGFLTTFTSFIALGLTLKKAFWYDLRLNKNFAWALTCFVPLILFLVGIQSFIGVISVVGGIMLGIDGILILLMYKKIGGKKYLVWPLCSIFFLGILYQIIYFTK